MNFETFATLCRICAADTRSRNSSPECVSILKTPMLQEKIEKFLHLKVSEGDALPKVICKSCYRSVEGIVSLSKIAIHTQMVLSNFLKPHAALIEPDSEYTSFAISCREFERNSAGNTLPPPLPVTNPPIHAKPKHPEEVVVNVSVSDPLTRETQQKIIGATQKRQSTMDTRFIPKSIAHRHVSFATSTPKEIRPLEPTNLSVNRKSSPTGVINYFNPQQQKQQVTVTSGGYVIGQVDASPRKVPIPTQALPSTAPIADLQATVPPMALTGSSSGNKSRSSSDNEQKRNNLKMTMKNMRASNIMNSGQVSLLKVSQKQNSMNQHSSPKPPPSIRANLLNTSRSDIPEEALQRGRALSPTIGRKSRRPPPQRRPTIAEIPSSVEALPKEIIIASVKKPKHTHSGERHSRSNADDVEGEIPKSLFPDDISLGRVIKDFDLLKLIMKALKWPVNKDNMEAQMSRLRNSKFTTIMSDPNLLQDTDLTQLLGPYLAPVLLAAQVLQQQQHQQQQQQHQQITASLSGDIPTDLSSNTTTNLANAIPYRLPPETSVQLVPASPEEERQMKSPQHSPRKSTQSNKRTRRPPEHVRQRDSSIVISDGEDEHASTSSNTRRKMDDKHKSKPSLESGSTHSGQRGSIDLSFNSSFDIGKQINERNRGGFDRAKSIVSQRKHIHPEHKAATTASTLYPSFVDDIVLIEPEQPKPTNIPSPVKNIQQKMSTGSLLSGISLSSSSNPFTARVVPPITRPIIKRRKTVIHASPSKTVMSSSQPEQTPESTIDNKEHTPTETPPKQLTSKDSLLSTTSTPELETTKEKSKSNLPQPTSEITTSSTTTTTTTIAAASTETKPLLKAIAPIASPSTKSINQPTTSTIKQPTTSQIIPPKTSPVTTPEASAITPKLNASTIPKLSTSSPSTTTTNLIKKVSVSTSMSFFGAASAITAEKELQPKKSNSGSKAALAQQLLEAVGLKKSNSTTSEKSASSEPFANSRESVQQIRSALKRSLKQAVEQNLRKLEEQPVIKQVADSTTKSIIKDFSAGSKIKQQPSSISKPIASIEIKDEIDNIESVDEKSEKPISLLKSSSTPYSEADKDSIQFIQEQAKQRNTGRQARKSSSTQLSVIKKPVSIALKNDDETKSTSETKSSEDQVSISASLSGLLNTGNTVSSTSETLQSNEAAQLLRKRGRKRKVDEETSGDGTENVEVDIKKDMKEKFETDSIGMGDSDLSKETSHIEDIDKKLDSGSSTARPSRASKTMSKYYKGPDKQASTRSTRSTRNRQ